MGDNKDNNKWQMTNDNTDNNNKQKTKCVGWGDNKDNNINKQMTIKTKCVGRGDNPWVASHSGSG